MVRGPFGPGAFWFGGLLVPGLFGSGPFGPGAFWFGAFRRGPFCLGPFVGGIISAYALKLCPKEVVKT